MSRGNGVAVIFVATNERALLLDAVESLWASAPSRPLEVVVVDNASVDGAGEEVGRRWEKVKVLRCSQRQGLAANLNWGVGATTAPYVMFCNSDIVFMPDAVDTLAGFLDTHPGAGIAGPKLLSPRGETWRSARRWYSVRALVALRWPLAGDPQTSEWARRSIYADWELASPRRVDWVPCPATMVRRAALDEVGGLDEQFRCYFDDVDLSLRMHTAGWEIWCVPEAEVFHYWRLASVVPLSAAWFVHLRSLAGFVWKHRGLRPRLRLPLMSPSTDHEQLPASPAANR